MHRATGIAGPRSLSDLLAGLELHGQCWCYSDLGAQAGFSVPPGDGVLVHAVLHGSVRVACAGGAGAELGEGDIVMALSGEAHALRASVDASVGTHEFLRDDRSVDIPPSIPFGVTGRVQARVLSGRLQADWPGEVNRASLPALLRLGGGEAETASALLRPDALAMAGMGAGSAALLTRIASLLLVAGLRAEPRCRELFAPARRDPIAQALQLIAGNPSAQWTVERLARSVGMGRSNFAAHFTERMGQAPMEVVAEQRMEHASALLRQGKLKIAEISEMAGYGSEAAFSRRFTRHFGFSPSQMRERARAAEAEAQAKPPTVQVQRLLAMRMSDCATPGHRISRPPTAAKPARAAPSKLIFLGSRD